jgi:hypothetical protein
VAALAKELEDNESAFERLPIARTLLSNKLAKLKSSEASFDAAVKRANLSVQLYQAEAKR